MLLCISGSDNQFQRVCVGGGLPTHHQAMLRTPLGCLTIQLSSDSDYLEIVSDSTGRGLSPTRSPSSWKPRSLPAHLRDDYKSEVSMTTSLGLVNLLEQFTELRKHIYSLEYWFITKDIKGYKSTVR